MTGQAGRLSILERCELAGFLDQQDRHAVADRICEAGAIGDAGLARTDKGEAAADYGVTAFIELLQDVEAFDLSRLVEI